MKWRLASLLLLTPLVLLILFVTTPANSVIAIFGGGGGANYFTYSQTIIIQPSTTQLVRKTQTGSTLQNLPWLVPSYVTVVNTNQLKIIPNCAYEYNNVSWSLKTPIVISL